MYRRKAGVTSAGMRIQLNGEEQTFDGVATVAAANRVKWQAEADEQTDPDPEAAAFLPEPGNDADETAEVLDADEAEVEPERQAA